MNTTKRKYFTWTKSKLKKLFQLRDKEGKTFPEIGKFFKTKDKNILNAYHRYQKGKATTAKAKPASKKRGRKKGQKNGQKYTQKVVDLVQKVENFCDGISLDDLIVVRDATEHIIKDHFTKGVKAQEMIRGVMEQLQQVD